MRIIEFRVLRDILGPRRCVVTGSWRKLHNEDLHDLCFLPAIIRVINSRRIRWAGHVAHMEKRRNAFSGKSYKKEITCKT
jgi:hypothetical protein